MGLLVDQDSLLVLVSPITSISSWSYLSHLISPEILRVIPAEECGDTARAAAGDSLMEGGPPLIWALRVTEVVLGEQCFLHPKVHAKRLVH